MAQLVTIKDPEFSRLFRKAFLKTSSVTMLFFSKSIKKDVG